MSTEYRVLTRKCVEPNLVAHALTHHGKNGWELVDSWRFEGWGDEMVALVLARRLESRPDPRQVTCSVCEGQGEYDPKDAIATLDRIADTYARGRRT